MPIFAFRSWLFKFRIWSYLHHKNVSDKQRKSKEEDFNLHYMFFRIVLYKFYTLRYLDRYILYLCFVTYQI